MKKKVKILGSVVLASLMAITGGIGVGNFKISNVQEVYAQTSDNVVVIKGIDGSASTVGINYFTDVVNLGITDTDGENILVFFDKNGNIINSFKGYWDNRKIISPKMPLRALETPDEKAILIDSKANVLIGEDKNFSNINTGDDTEILTFVKKNRETGETESVGFIDKNGNILKELPYDSIYGYVNKKAVVTKGRKSFYVDLNGKTYFEDKNFFGLSNYPDNEDDLISFSTMKEDGTVEFGYMTTSGEILPKKEFKAESGRVYEQSELFPTVDGIAKLVSRDEDGNWKECLFDIKNNKQITKEYAQVSEFSANGFAIGQIYDPETNTVSTDIINKNDIENPINKPVSVSEYVFFNDFKDINLKYIPIISNDSTSSEGLMDLEGNIILSFGEKTTILTTYINDKDLIVAQNYGEGEYGGDIGKDAYIIDLSKGIPKEEDFKNAKVVTVSPDSLKKTFGNDDTNATNNKPATNTTNNNTTSIPTDSIKYKVQKWDTLGNISLRNYGSYAYHQELYKINKEAFAKTKGKLVPGMEIILPAKIGNAPRLAPLDATKGTIHTVKAGETLGSISNKYYKTPSKYNIIFNANKDRIKKANMIYEGQQILIPNIK